MRARLTEADAARGGGADEQRELEAELRKIMLHKDRTVLIFRASSTSRAPQEPHEALGCLLFL